MMKTKESNSYLIALEKGNISFTTRLKILKMILGEENQQKAVEIIIEKDKPNAIGNIMQLVEAADYEAARKTIVEKMDASKLTGDDLMRIFRKQTTSGMALAIIGINKCDKTQLKTIVSELMEIYTPIYQQGGQTERMKNLRTGIQNVAIKVIETGLFNDEEMISFIGQFHWNKDDLMEAVAAQIEKQI